MRNLAPALILAILLNSCFTGVESTPRITFRGETHIKSSKTPEGLFSEPIHGEPVSQWVNGKVFVVEPGKITYALTPWENANMLEPGDTLRYLGLRSVTSPTGAEQTNVMLGSTVAGNLAYSIEEPLDAVLSKERLEIPFTVELSIVDSARHVLAGKDMWIMTPQWYADDSTTMRGRKMIPVHIDSVSCGTSLLPVKAWFTDDRNTHAMVYVTPASNNRLTRSFESQFSLTDPRQRYRDIDADMWECITHSTVKVGMSRRECRLSIGVPSEVTTAHYMERWDYGNGRYIIFDDDRVVQFKL